jgi:aspartate carbamoyltransferase catalytic subunit
MVSIPELSRDDILHILNTTDRLSQDPERHNIMRGKILATVFYESSTRTKISFNVAMKRLGGNVIGFSHFKNSSFLKGESFYDTLRILEGYCDIMALRAPWEGSARYASEVVNVPVINAGDGSNQHPTQTLLDLYTIRQTQGRLDKLKIGMLGDLKYGRTVHSLLMGLAQFDVELTLISPESLRVPKRYFSALNKAGIPYREITDYHDVLPELDVLYVTRIQKERFVDQLEYSRVQSAYRLALKDLKGVRDNFRIMHPLPRVDEISRDIDSTPYAVYFQQAKNGVAVREALIALLAGGDGLR